MSDPVTDPRRLHPRRDGDPASASATTRPRAAFREMVDVRNEIEADGTARTTSRYGPRSCSRTGSDPHQPKRLLLRASRRAHRRARASLEVQLDASTDVGWLLDRDAARRSAGAASAPPRSSVSSQLAAEGGQIVLQGWSLGEGDRRRADHVADRLRIDPVADRLGAIRARARLRARAGRAQQQGAAARGCRAPPRPPPRPPRDPTTGCTPRAGDVPDAVARGHRAACSPG